MEYNLLIPLDIWQYILNAIDFINQIRLRQICKILYEKLIIYDFYSINRKYLNLLTDDILKNYKNIFNLQIITNHIQNINHIITLQKLCISTCNQMKEINNLTNLKELITVNPHIKNISNLTKLEKLTAQRSSGICDSDIIGLTNLSELDVWDNAKITNVNHLTNLKKLVANRHSGINNNGISALVKLEELYVSHNHNIRNINHLTNLKYLHAEGFSCGISNSSICKLNLIRLNARENIFITNHYISNRNLL